MLSAAKTADLPAPFGPTRQVLGSKVTVSSTNARKFLTRTEMICIKALVATYKYCNHIARRAI